MGCTRSLGKNGKKIIKEALLIEGEQLFLYATHCLDLIYIPITFHEDILNSYRVMGCTRM